MAVLRMLLSCCRFALLQCCIDVVLHGCVLVLVCCCSVRLRILNCCFVVL